MKTLAADAAGLDEAAGTLLSGGVAVIPTDTVYGLAAHPGFPAAVERLYSIKNREAKKPIALLASDLEAISKSGFPITGKAAELAEKHWPGALTLVVENGSGAVEAFRIPNHRWTRRLLAACGGLLRVTSANISGGRPATDAPEALASVGLEADLVVDGGVSRDGVASAVVKVSHFGETTVLRPGKLFNDAR